MIHLTLRGSAHREQQSAPNGLHTSSFPRMHVDYQKLGVWAHRSLRRDLGYTSFVMRMRILWIAWMVAGVGFAQSRPVSPRFDVASVKPTRTVQAGYGFERITVHPASLTMRNVRLRIKWAYDVRH
jgi:hypothetical protein